MCVEEVAKELKKVLAMLKALLSPLVYIKTSITGSWITSLVMILVQPSGLCGLCYALWPGLVKATGNWLVFV